MSELIISVSGLRGIVGQTLTPLVVAKYIAAFARCAPDGPVVVSRDGRATGDMLARGVHSALMAAGRDVIDAGVAATPTTGVLVREANAAGGVQISASHNPRPYNGLKLFSPEGRVIPAGEGERVLQQYNAAETTWAAFDQTGACSTLSDTTSAHLAKVLATVDVEAIRSKKFRVLLDSNHGAGAVLGAKLLDALGCTAVITGAEPTGDFIHEPEPTAENLQDIGHQVVAHKAVAGFCQDPDADRLALIDAGGRYVGEEFTVAICLKHVLDKAKETGNLGHVVTNCSTSRMSEDIALAAGASFSRSAVGEANVTDEMIARNAIFGGEGNGGPIDPRVGYVRDSFVGMALVLSAMASTGKTLAELAGELPQYHIHKTKAPLDRQQIPSALAALKQRFPDAAANEMDGLRLDWPGRWLLLRASNTEPIIRIIAEAGSASEAQEMCEQAAQTLQS